MPNFIDLTGKKFFQLTVLKRAETVDSRTYWECLCDCGNITTIRADSLRSDNTKSCGCRPKGGAGFKNEIGNSYGKLFVVSRAPNQGRRAMWNCICECGNEVIIRGDSLRNGHTQSCGCLISKAENQIRDLFKKKNINFKTQFSFSDLRGVNNGLLRFDFAVMGDEEELKFLLEFDGPQHFNVSDNWYKDWLIKHDQMKIDYCQKNNIKFYTITYLDDIRSSLEVILKEESLLSE